MPIRRSLVAALLLHLPVAAFAQSSFGESITEVLEEPEKIAPVPYMTGRPAKASQSSAISYHGCDEVRISGRAPIYAGQPGYHPAMDSDGDGVACEHYPGALEEAIARTAQRAARRAGSRR